MKKSSPPDVAQLSLSQSESTYLNLRVGRGKFDDPVNVSELLNELLTMQLDLVKLRVNAVHDNIFKQLDKIGFPYFINSVLYRNKIDYSNSIPIELPEGYSYELYSNDNLPQFQNILEQVYEANTGVNYNSALYHAIIGCNVEKQMAVDYYLNFRYASNPQKIAWLLKQGESCIGFVCGDFADYGFEGRWYGLLPKYRGMGLSSLLIDIIRLECNRRGVIYFYNDVQYQNIYSQLNVMRNGAVPVSSYLNIFLLPMISFVNARGETFHNTTQEDVFSLAKKAAEDNPCRLAFNLIDNTTYNAKPSHYVKCSLGNCAPSIYMYYDRQHLMAQCITYPII